jgi:hypothetical protein
MEDHVVTFGKDRGLLAMDLVFEVRSFSMVQHVRQKPGERTRDTPT